MAAPPTVVPADSPEDLRPRLEKMLSAGMFTAAFPLAERFVALAPNDPSAWVLLGVSLRGDGRPEAAAAAHRRALELAPDSTGVLSNLGNALKDMQRLDEAVAVHYRAVQIEPRSVTSWLNLAVALRERGGLQESLNAFEHVLQLDPNHVSAHTDRAQILLMQGEYAPAWDEFEWRWKLPELKPPGYEQPRWQGEAAHDSTILLWPEQGFGDSLMGARYLPWVKQRVGRVLLGCRPELRRIFTTVPGVDQVLVTGEQLPHFDLQCPLLSLPGVFGAEIDSVPPPVQFRVPPESRAKVAPLIARAGARFKVGIVWSGSLGFKSNHLRSASLNRFLGFAEIPSVQLFSLQKGPREADLGALGARSLVIDLAPALDDFADTAAAVDALDLVIMTDSSVAHLTGSRGKPIWNLLSYIAYWPYQRDRVDTPWYPSMRLFRQPTPGEWDAVFAEARGELQALVAARR